MHPPTSPPTLTPLATSSPPRPTARPPPFSRPSIHGRLSTPRHAPSLSTFLSAADDASSSSASEPDAAPADTQHYDLPRRRTRRPKSRIARPKDAMPGFKRRRYHSRRGPPRAATSTVGARHLDRGLSAAAYYGRGGGDAAPDAGGDARVADELSALERAALGTVAGAAPPPVCPGHGEPCARLTCKKAGRNKGRDFFKCAMARRYEQCDFFRWADEIPRDAFSDGEDGVEFGDVRPAVDAPALMDGADDDVEQALDDVLHDVFGFAEYRPGQREAICRLLQGRSTLALMPTGGGKSLVYQAFAALRPGLVVVVTPLVSLMLDQLSALPEGILGACLRSGQNMDVIRATEEKVRAGEVKVLFISPERVFSSRFRRLMLGNGAPRVSLVVVDEAHCISQWSHNFRTAYLRIPNALFRKPDQDEKGPGSGFERPVFDSDPPILALTATATAATVAGICDNLKIDAKEGVMRYNSARDNLTLTLSHVDGPLEAKAYELVRQLRLEPFGKVLGLVEAEADGKANAAIDESADAADDDDEIQQRTKKRRRPSKSTNLEEEERMIGWGSNLHVSKRVRGPKHRKAKHIGSVIVYVSKQRDCEALLNYLKSSTLKIQGKFAMYHAGMAQKDRCKVQSQFESGSIPVLVATVAFGMGLNYSNVLGIIHFDMPSSLEGYSQEVGRAGRDGRPAACHVFYNEYDGCKLRSRSHSDGVDQNVVRQFLRKLVENSFEHKPVGQRLRGSAKVCVDDSEQSDVMNCNITGNTTRSLVLSISESELCRTLDLKYETAETVCAILESKMRGVRLLRPSHTKVRVRFFSQTPESLLGGKSKALRPIDKFVIQQIQTYSKQCSGHYDLTLSKAAMLEDDVGGSLRRLQTGRHISFEVLERGVHVQCSLEAFELLHGDVERWARVAHCDLERIERIREHKALAVVETFSMADGMLSDMQQSAFLHEALAKYFAADVESCKPDVRLVSSDLEKLDKSTKTQLHQACKALLNESGYGAMRPQSGRQIGRILHGIDSAGFRAKDWWGCGFWRKFIEVDFRVVTTIAREVIREQHTLRRGRATNAST